MSLPRKPTNVWQAGGFASQWGRASGMQNHNNASLRHSWKLQFCVWTKAGFPICSETGRIIVLWRDMYEMKSLSVYWWLAIVWPFWDACEKTRGTTAEVLWSKIMNICLWFYVWPNKKPWQWCTISLFFLSMWFKGQILHTVFRAFLPPFCHLHVSYSRAAKKHPNAGCESKRALE